MLTSASGDLRRSRARARRPTFPNPIIQYRSIVTRKTHRAPELSLREGPGLSIAQPSDTYTERFRFEKPIEFDEL